MSKAAISEELEGIKMCICKVGATGAVRRCVIAAMLRLLCAQAQYAFQRPFRRVLLFHF